MLCYDQLLPIHLLYRNLEAISLENLDLGVKRRRNFERRVAYALEIRVEKSVQAISCHGKLTTSVYSQSAEQTKCSAHDVALQQGSVITKSKMESATDLSADSSIRRQAIINRLMSPSI